ncbi:hypothetical protein CI610_03698 [invertebrate metagenome]|uniref:Uncharacterized protein n=1 Tax=invertebrate metagenome TaxID=1711999 RepID=A0A2H9T2D5_9ZZZZ
MFLFRKSSETMTLVITNPNGARERSLASFGTKYKPLLMIPFVMHSTF